MMKNDSGPFYSAVKGEQIAPFTVNKMQSMKPRNESNI